MTLRSAIIGLVCIAILAAVTPYTELALKGSALTHNHLPTGVFFIFLVLVGLLNTVPARLWPSKALTRAELAVIYIMMMIGAAMPSLGYVTLMTSVTAGVQYLATPENKWQSLFFEYIPSWIMLRDDSAVKWFYEGMPEGARIPWGAWALPIISWTIFAFLFFAAYFFLGVILRKQWIENERLTFPLAQVPLEVMGEGARPSGRDPFWKNKLMWIGAIAVFLLHANNGIYHHTGLTPYIQLVHLKPFIGLVNRPWDALKDDEIFFFPSVVGLTYLLSAEVAASLWVFFWVNRFQAVLIRAWGLGEPGSGVGFNQTTFFRGQEAGAFIALTFFLFWGARRQLGETLRAALRREPDPTQPVPLHWALVGFGACSVLLPAWGVAAGMSWLMAFLALVMFYTVAIGLTRLVSAGGILYVECSFLPQDVMNNFLGSNGVGPGNLTTLAFQQRMFMFNQEVTFFPYLMNSLKMAHAAKIPGRQTILALALGLLAAVGFSYYTVLRLVYTHGGSTLDQNVLTLAPEWSFNKLRGFIDSPLERNALGISSTLGGAAVMIGLLLLNRNYLWWRLNPLGYLMGSTGTLSHIWTSVFIGWAAGTLVLKFGGWKIYRRLRPFFIGMIIGEFTAAVFWLALDSFTGVREHYVFPVE